MGDADGNMKKESRSHDVKEGTPQSVLQVRLSPLYIVSLCGSGSERGGSTRYSINFNYWKSQNVHDLHLCFNTSLIFN